MEAIKVQRRNTIRRRIRRKIAGSAECPRLSVFRSNKQIYAQLIDDVAGRTLAAASSMEVKAEGKATKSEQAGAVGKALGEKAVQAGITQAVFDRGGYLYHGRVKALADGARSAGLKF
jgi:large subunit ribosomal protein L18